MPAQPLASLEEIVDLAGGQSRGKGLESGDDTGLIAQLGPDERIHVGSLRTWTLGVPALLMFWHANHISCG